MSYPNGIIQMLEGSSVEGVLPRSSISSLKDEGIVRAPTARFWMGLVVQRDTAPDSREIRGPLEWLLMPWADRQNISMVRIPRKVNTLELGPGSRQTAWGIMGKGP